MKIMKRNRLFIYLLLLLPALVMQSCLKNQEDFFEEPSSERLANFNANAYNTLRSSENGWVLDYYPGSGAQYGGVSMVVKFDSLQATFYSEFTSSDESVTSYYKMTNEAGATIIFDTYNDILHYFSEGTSSRYQAMGGDIEFVIDSIGEDVVKVHGARSRNTMYFRRLAKAPEEYIAEVQAVAEDFVYGKYKGNWGGQDVDVTLDLNSYQASFAVQGAEEVTTVSTAFCLTDYGMRLYKPVTVNGVTLTDFDFDYDAGTLSARNVATPVVLQGELPEGYRKFADYEGDYTLTYNRGTKSVKVHLTPDEANSCYYMTGLFANKPDVPVVVTYSKSEGNLMICSQMVGLTSSNQVWICAWDTTSGNLTWNTSAGVKSIWNGDEENPSYSFVNNGLTTYAIDSFIMWTLNAAGTASTGQYSGTDYKINNSAQMAFWVSLAKIKE